MRPLEIRPSSASRWLNCPGYPRVQTIANCLPQEPDPPYAAEGTAAHAWLEFYLGGTVVPPYDDEGEVLEIPDDDKKLLSDIADNIMWYAETCGYKIETEKEYSVEITLSDDRAVPILGHIDILLSSDTSLVVLDYKHGEGRAVSAAGNPQTMLYLLAAWEGRAAEGHSPPENFAMGIIQPRGVGDGLNIVTVTAAQLLSFKADVTKAVEAAYQDEVVYYGGSHCWKCPGRRGMCPAWLTVALDCVVQTPSKDVFEDKDVERTLDKVFGGVLPWALLDTIDDVRAFIKELSSYADVYLKAGREIPGWGLETVQGRRKWSHPDEVAGALAEILGGAATQYERTTTTPITLTEAERRAKKVGKKIDGLLEKPVTQKRVKTENSGPMGFTAVE